MRSHYVKYLYKEIVINMVNYPTCFTLHNDRLYIKYIMESFP